MPADLGLKSFVLFYSDVVFVGQPIELKHLSSVLDTDYVSSKQRCQHEGNEVKIYTVVDDGSRITHHILKWILWDHSLNKKLWVQKGIQHLIWNLDAHNKLRKMGIS